MLDRLSRRVGTVSIESRGSRRKGSFPAAGASPAPGKAQMPTPTPKVGLRGRLQGTFQAHPRLVTWLVLAVGMVAILLWTSSGADLLFHQRLVLILATVGLAGLCAWIINWET